MPPPSNVSVSGDTTIVRADTSGLTADRVGQFAAPTGWPCALLGGVPPSVEDKQSNPTADDLLPAVLALTPRGPAWGSDEAGDGSGASPLMRLFWRGVATFFADVNRRDFEVATQALPSAITMSLPDWEADYGLPDPCLASQNTIATRTMAVRARFGALGGQSREYMICLAKAVGYDITIEEPTQFFCEDSEIIDGGVLEGYFLCEDTQCDEPVETFQLYAPPGVYGDEVAGGIFEEGLDCEDGGCDDKIETYRDDPAGTVWKYWIARVSQLEETWFDVAGGTVTETAFHCEEDECDDPLEAFELPPDDASDPEAGEAGFTPIEGFLAADDLECVLRRACPPHTVLVFSYSAPAV